MGRPDQMTAARESEDGEISSMSKTGRTRLGINLVLSRLYNQHYCFDIGITPRSGNDKIDVNHCQRRLDQLGLAIGCQKQL